MATTKKASKKAVNKGRKASRPTRTKVAKAATAKAVKATTGRTMLFHPDTKIKLLQKLPKEDDAISEMFGVRTTSKRFKTWPAAARCKTVQEIREKVELPTIEMKDLQLRGIVQFLHHETGKVLDIK